MSAWLRRHGGDGKATATTTARRRRRQGLILISAPLSFPQFFVVIFPDLVIVCVGFYPALFPKKDGSVPAWLVTVQMLALEAEAGPPILVVNPPNLDVVQELCKPLTFPAAGFSLAASAISLCNCVPWPSSACHSLAPLKFELIKLFLFSMIQLSAAARPL